MKILEEIAEKARERVAADKRKIPLEQMKKMAFDSSGILEPFAFEKALRQSDISFICEVKKASPSKGIISEDFPYLDIAMDYERAGAACISVLTEPFYFKGSDSYLSEIRKKVRIPIIRKDFTIDAYQIYQAKVLGADCVLLICSLLSEELLREYLGICDSLGLSALVEAHNEEEIASAIAAGARIIGVNNRNLKNFTVDVENSTRLRNLVPDSIIFVAESGIRTGKDIDVLRKNHVDAVLIGETLMKAPDKKAMLSALRGTKIKICGLTRRQDIEAVNQYKPEYVGFVFAGSRRKVTDDQAAELKAMLDPEIQAVGVFVDESISHIEELCRRGIIDMVQLHGSEDEAYIHALREKISQPIIKAFPAKSAEQLELDIRQCSADYILVDAMAGESFGGTGTRFDLALLPDTSKPLFLAGGISAANVSEIIAAVHPYAVDVSSKVETDGSKDAEKIKEIIEKVNCHDIRNGGLK